MTQMDTDGTCKTHIYMTEPKFETNTKYSIIYQFINIYSIESWQYLNSSWFGLTPGTGLR